MSSWVMGPRGGDAARADGRAEDAAGVAFLLLLLLAYVPFALDFRRHPEEDAAMLLRYAGHMAAGHGIVWNVGEAPLDGATDFLFLVLLAAVHRAGVGLEAAAQGLGLLAHAAAVLIVFLGARRVFGTGAPLALLPAVFLALGPGLRHLAAGYGTPLFALACLVVFLASVRLAKASQGQVAGPALAFAFSGLLAGLARPEGVFFAAFGLAAVLLARGGRDARTIISRFLLVFLTLGLAYFLWRLAYFGHPLPNPFYRKGAFLLHWHSLRQSWRNVVDLAGPFLPVLAVGLFVRRARPPALLACLPVALFACLFVLVSDETNYFMRFRYPVLGVVALGATAVAHVVLGPLLQRRPLAAGAALLAVTAGLGVFQHWRYRHVEARRMGLYDAAQVLRDYRRFNYALVTTEAGLLPLYSTWRAVDAWGLNDAFVARHGTITDAYLDRYRPELILFHAYFSPGTPESGPRIENRSLGPAWHRMVMTLKAYAERNGYVLAAVYGRNAYDTHYYYVRAGFPRSREIVERLRALDYRWDGEPTFDFAAAARERAEP